jgi:hypothetical protein
MKRIGFGSRGVVRLGVPSSQDDQPSAGFEELAMPLFDSLLQFCALAGTRFERCRRSRTRNLPQGFTQFRIVSVRHQFSGRECFES